MNRKNVITAVISFAMCGILIFLGECSISKADSTPGLNSKGRFKASDVIFDYRDFELLKTAIDTGKAQTYEEAYQAGYEAGRIDGQNEVKASPGSFGIMSLKYKDITMGTIGSQNWNTSFTANADSYIPSTATIYAVNMLNTYSGCHIYDKSYEAGANPNTAHTVSVSVSGRIITLSVNTGGTRDVSARSDRLGATVRIWYYE